MKSIRQFYRTGLLTLTFMSLVGVIVAQEWTEIRKPNLPGTSIFDLYAKGDKIVAVGYIADGTNSVFETSVLISNNAGDTWAKQKFQDVFYKCIAFPNEQDGYIGGFGLGTTSYILRSTDKGDNWGSHFIDPVQSGITDMQFIDENIGYASGYGSFQFGNANLYKTTDGGQNWNAISTTVPSTTFDEIQFFDENTGYAMSTVYFDGTLLGKDISVTIDGGVTWTLVYTHNDALGGMYWKDFDNGFFVDELGGIYKTTDAGQNWNKIKDTEKLMTSINFFNDNVGFAVGLEGTIVKTKDGGATWENVVSGTQKHLVQVVYQEDKVYVMGADGIILRADPLDDSVGEPGDDPNGWDPTTWPVGIEEISTLELQVWPNPTSGQFNVDGLLKDQQVEVVIYDLGGRQVTQQRITSSSSQVDVNHLAPGMYFYQLSVGQAVQKGKIIVE